MWVGIDPSLTGTAVAIISEDGGLRTVKLVTTGRANAPHADTLARLNKIERWVRDRLDELGRIDLTIGIEGPSLAPQRMGLDHERAGLWWRLYTRASQYGDVVVVYPKQRAKYATGNGNAGKDAVLFAVTRRFSGFVGGNDEADALTIAAMLARLDGHPIDDPLPKPHLAALDKFHPAGGES